MKLVNRQHCCYSRAVGLAEAASQETGVLSGTRQEVQG